MEEASVNQQNDTNNKKQWQSPKLTEVPYEETNSGINISAYLDGYGGYTS